MKTIPTNFKKIILSVLFLLSMNGNVFSQGPNDYNLCLKNLHQTSSSVLEFDIWLEWTGTNTQKFQYFQGGLNFNYAGMANGGTITGAFVAGSADPSLPAVQQAPNWNINSTSKQIRMISAIASASLAIAIPAPPGIRLGTFRMTNTVSFSSSSPNFAWSYAIGTSTTTQTKESFYLNSSSTATGFVDASPFPNHCPLPPLICLLPPCATANVGGPYVSCGDFQLNGSFANATSASYSTSGTGTFDPDNSTLNAIYHPSNADLLNGVTITLTAIGGTGGSCSGACPPAVSSVFVTFNSIDDNNLCTADACNSTTGMDIHTPVIAVTSNINYLSSVCSNDGAITLSVNGGLPPYVYSWSNGASTQNITGLKAGTFSVIVTDANSCTVSLSSVVTTTPVSSARTNVAIYIRDNILSGSLANVRLWMSDSALSNSFVARDIHSTIPDYNLPFSQTWVVMIDDIPQANFGHEVRWVFLQNGNLSNHIIQTGKNFPPTIWLGPTRANFECTDFTTLGALPCVLVAPCGIIPVPNYIAPTPDNCLHAVLISGGWDKKANYDRYPNNLIRMYNILRNSGYSKNNIYTFYSNGNPFDLDNDDNDNDSLTGSDITGAASKINISSQLLSLCNLLSASTSKLFVYVTNHGDNGGDIMLWDFNNNGIKDPDESIYPSEMASWTNNCQVCRDFYVMDQCHSGAFVNPLIGNGHPNSVVYTAASAGEDSWWSMYLDQWEQNFSCQTSMDLVHLPISNINSTPQKGEGTPGNGNDKLCNCCLYISVTAFNPLCNGELGSMSFLPGGGDGPYTIQTNPCPPNYPCMFTNTYGFSTTAQYPAGTYIVTVTDANGNTSTQSVTITVPSPLIAHATSVATACDPCTGQITSYGSGGTPFNINLPHTPYNYTFTQLVGNSPNIFVSSGPLNNDPVYEYANNLCPGEFIVTVTDVNGCTATTSVSVEVIGQNQCCTNPPDSMVAWWPFDESSGSAAADIVGGHYGNIGSSVTINVPGIVNSAIRINRHNPIEDIITNDDLVTVANAPEFNFGYGDLTIDAWIYGYSVGGGGIPLIDKPHAYRLMFAPPSPGFHWHLGPSEPPIFIQSGNPVITLNQWHHIAGVVDQDFPVPGKTTLILYVDGVSTTSLPFNQLFNLSSSDDLQIGGRANRFPDFIFDGKIDELEMFNRALSSDEINAIYNAGVYGKCKPSCNTPGSDIYMKDTPNDAGIEPNPDNSPMWLSQDIWNRNEYHSTAQIPNNTNQNGFETNENQNPEYYNTFPFNKNYIYVKVRNKGCDPTPGNEELKVYWSTAATGMNWDGNYVNNDWVNNIKTIAGCAPATKFGDEITNHFGNLPIIIPSLKPGETKIFEIPWNAPNPNDFICFGPEKNHICFLARIEGDPLSPGDHIEFPEVTPINSNVNYNNNIIWRNTALVDHSPYKMPIFISKKNNVTTNTIKFITPSEESNNQFFDYGSIKVDLGSEVYSSWVSNGMQGSGFTLSSGTTLILNSINSFISGIQGFPNEIERIKLEFVLQPLLPNSARKKYNFDVVQVIHLQNGDSLISGQRITLNISCPNPVLKGIPVICSGNNSVLSVVDLNNTATSYQWKLDGTNIPGANTDSLTFSSNGIYTVELTDNNGCISSASNTVTTPVPVSVTAAVTSNYSGSQISCNGSADGQLTLLGSGGSGHYNFSVDGGLTFIDDADIINSLSSGSYSVVATDGNGCTGSTSVSIIEPPVLVTTSSSTNVNCAGFNNGKATTTTTGGTPPYSYLWSNNETTQNIFNLAAGLYTVTVTDANGCTSSSSTLITVDNCNIILSLNIFLQGFYTSNGMMDNSGAGGFMYITSVSGNSTDADTLKISVMQPNYPFALVEEQKGILQTDGNISVAFGTEVIAGNSYYLKINHLNSVETWSKTPVVLNSVSNYSFTSAATQAYGDNLTLTPDNLYYSIFTGDINQDGAIDGSDFLELDPKVQNGEGGYNNGDLNGDGAVDGTDFLLLDPNVQSGVGIINP